MVIRSYKDLIVWQKAIDLVKEVYILTAVFPKSEIYGISMQMRRAAVSIPSNIAEGFGRRSKRQYNQGCLIAYGSSLELETQTFIAKQLKLADLKEFIKVEALLDEVIRMLNKMTNTMKNC